MTIKIPPQPPLAFRMPAEPGWVCVTIEDQGTQNEAGEDNVIVRAEPVGFWGVPAPTKDWRDAETVAREHETLRFPNLGSLFGFAVPVSATMLPAPGALVPMSEGGERFDARGIVWLGQTTKTFAEMAEEGVAFLNRCNEAIRKGNGTPKNPPPQGGSAEEKP